MIVVAVTAATLAITQAQLPTLLATTPAELNPTEGCCETSDDAAPAVIHYVQQIEHGSAPMCPEEGCCDCGCCATVAPATPLLVTTAALVWTGDHASYLLKSPADYRPDAVWLGVPFHPPIA
jgi:hypothetical protein